MESKEGGGKTTLNGHGKTQTNGHAGPAVPAPAATPPKPKKKGRSTVDDFTEVQQALNKATQQCYAEGLRRGATIIAMAVGKLDGAAKQAIVAAIDQLENELHEAEAAASSSAQ